jgi:hypothetical protein
VLLIWLIFALLPAWGAKVSLVARLRPDLQTVEGELTLTDGDGLHFVDALSLLPVPTDDVLSRRTFPRAAESGWLRLSPRGPDRMSFTAVLPRRYDAAGYVPGHGLFMNGLWHPMVMEGDHLAVVDWEVRLTLPPGTTGVLNGSVSTGEVIWGGRADRLSLAVLEDAEVSTLEQSAGSVTLVQRGRARERRDLRLSELIEVGWPGPGAPHVVIVEAPLRRRLSRAGPGMLFLSDRALRLSGPLWRYHSAATLEGVIQAGLPLSDPWWRAFAAAALLPADDKSVRELLGWVRWIPEVDALLYDGRLPFYSDVMGETWPGDPVHDDPAELFAPSTPARAAARNLDLRHGPGTAARLAGLLLQGASPGVAATGAGLSIEEVSAMRQPTPASDLALRVEERPEGGWQVAVDRPGAIGAPATPVELEVNGQRQRIELGVGTPAYVRVEPARPASVAVDPRQLSPDPNPSNNRWPRPWTVVAAIFPYELSLNSGRISAEANLVFRRRYATRWSLWTSLSTDPEDLLGLDVGATYAFGPLKDRRSRPFHLWFGGGPSLLDPAFRPTDDGAIAIGAYTGASWDTRVDDEFPRHGHRLSLSFGGGAVPGGDEWGSAHLNAVQLLPLGGRAALALRAGAGVAEGGVEHRLLSLGGSSNLQGVPVDAVLGDTRLIGAAELRYQVFRGLSVPLPLVWLADVQLLGGAEAGYLGAHVAGCPTEPCAVEALGWTAGALFTGDVLGARPTMLGLWAAHPLWSDDAALTASSTPTFYVRGTQAF